MDDLGRLVPDGLGAAGRRDAGPRPLAAGPRQGRLRRPGRGRRARRRQVRASCDAASQVVVDYDPLPVVVDPEKALEAGSPRHPRRVRHQHGVRVVARRRRHGGRLPRRRRGRREADRQPPHGRGGDRAAQLPRPVARGQAHLLELDPDPAHLPRAALDPARDHRGEDPRRRARGGRRLRLQARRSTARRSSPAGARAGPAGRSSTRRPARRRCWSPTTGATRSTT